jgi:hypothetical protein
MPMSVAIQLDLMALDIISGKLYIVMRIFNKSLSWGVEADDPPCVMRKLGR